MVIDYILFNFFVGRFIMSKSIREQSAYLRWLARQLSSPGLPAENAAGGGSTYLDLRQEYVALTTKLSPSFSRVRRAARAAKHSPTPATSNYHGN